MIGHYFMSEKNIQPSFLFAQRARRSKKATFAIRLTSMIDIFTILLVFLLSNYSSEGHIISVSEDLHLPESTSLMKPKVASVISLTSEWILVDGRPIEKIKDAMAQNDLFISTLNDELMKLRAFSEGVGEISSDLKGFQGQIAIQGDRNITFELLKKIMLTCGSVGYNNMLLTVMQKE